MWKSPAANQSWSSTRACSGVVVATPSTVELAQRAPGAADRRRPVRAPDHDLGQQRVVERGDLARPAPASCRSAPTARPAAAPARPCPAAAGSRGPGPRRRSGTRSRARAPRSVLGQRASGSPAAIRSCSATRSTPVTSSVVGCSTWMRVFISMKKKSPRRRRRGTRRCRRRCSRPPGPVAPPPRSSPPGSPPRSPGEPASSTTFCRRRCSEHSRSNRCTTSRPSPSTCTSTCRARRTNRSRYIRPSPNAVAASRVAAGKALRSPASSSDHPDAAPAATGRRLEHHRVADLGRRRPPPRPRRPRRPRCRAPSARRPREPPCGPPPCPPSAR